MLHTINAQNLLNTETETHYDFRTGVPTSEYPQVHDFFEFTFVTSGSFYIDLMENRHEVREGDLIMLFPNIIHAKYENPKQTSSHINLAFLSTTMDEVFTFLYGKTPEKMVPDLTQIIVRLTKNEKTRLQAAMEYLTFFPGSEVEVKRIYARKLLCDIIYEHVMPTYFAIGRNLIIPNWMQNLISEMQNPDNLFDGMKFILKCSGKTKSHICRSFKKYLNTTPTKYINSNRLTYVANMLHHSDIDILTLSNNVGFISTSYFYSLFKAEFGVTPLQYRNLYQKGRSNL